MTEAWWKGHDWILTGVIIALMTIGLLMLWSMSLGSQESYLSSQVMFVVVSLVAYLFIAQIPVATFLHWSWVGYAATFVLLLVVAIFAQTTRGAASWLDFGPVSLQPAEFMKVALVLFMGYLVERSLTYEWSGIKLLLALAVAGALPLGLILLQPDFGTAMVILVGWLAVVWLSPIHRKVLLLVPATLIAGAGIGWGLLADYQRLRILNFIHPSADPLGSGYNVLQSIIAVGSGNFWGQGWGRGTQSHLLFLPEHHTDFIFASLSEEFGFVGSAVVVVLYALLLWRGARVLWFARSNVHALVAGGIISFILFQAIINMAMNVGMSPVTGVPLPLVSYGGSSLLATCIGLGLINNMARQQAAERESERLMLH